MLTRVEVNQPNLSYLQRFRAGFWLGKDRRQLLDQSTFKSS